MKALSDARNRFGINGQLAGAIDDILSRHDSIVAEISADESTHLDRDDSVLSGVLLDSEEADGAAMDADDLFEDEEDEVDDGDAAADGDTGGDAGGLFEDGPEDEGAPESTEAVATAAADHLFDDHVAGSVDAPGDDDDDADEYEYGVPVDSTLFDDGEGPGGPTETDAEEAAPLIGDGEGAPGDMDDLFDSGQSAEEATPAAPIGAEPAAKSATQPPPRKSTEKASKVGQRPLAEKSEDSLRRYNVLAHTVSLDDIQAALDISIPRQDVTSLEQNLRAKLEDRVFAALSASTLMERQYILIPRIARFVHGGKTMPCTAVNLARTFTSVFGDLRDLARYRQHALMTHEVPESGWALVTAETPRESLDKSFMEQNQYLRYLATSLGIPSHLVRRRTLVEAIYDVIVGRLVLGETLQRQTLDWTSSGPTKTDFICIYSANEGIRLRAMSRTSRHGSLGVCPNW